MINSQIEKAKQFKEQGNAAYQIQDFKKALSNYHRVFLYLNGLQHKNGEMNQYAAHVDKMDDEQFKIGNNLKQTTHLNMSQIYLNQAHYGKAKHSVSESLKLLETAKGFYRLGIAELHLENVEESRTAFLKAQELDKKIFIEDVLQQLHKLEKKTDKQLAEAMKKMWIQ